MIRPRRCAAGRRTCWPGCLVRRWAGGWTIDLSSLGAGQGPVGELPGASLPLIASLLGTFFELDNTGDPEAAKGPAGAQSRKRIAPPAPGAKGRSTPSREDEVEASDEAEVAANRSPK